MRVSGRAISLALTTYALMVPGEYVRSVDGKARPFCAAGGAGRAACEWTVNRKLVRTGTCFALVTSLTLARVLAATVGVRIRLIGARADAAAGSQTWVGAT